MHAVLSKADNKILRLLVDSEGRVSSDELSRELRIPRTSIGRMRKRLEETYVVKQYSLDPTKFGWRRIDLLIQSNGGKTLSISKALLRPKEVIYVARMTGEHTIDFRVETVVKDYKMLLNLIENMKTIKGVRNVVWTEIVQTIGKKNPSNLVAF